MDKLAIKEILRANCIPQVRFVPVTRIEYETNPDAITAAAAELTLPWFIKPAASGSSIGITKVVHIRELDAAIRQAFAFGSRVVIEEGVAGLCELEVAVIGNEYLQVSPVGEITHSAEFYDFATKYTPDAAHLLIPAPDSRRVLDGATEDTDEQPDSSITRLVAILPQHQVVFPLIHGKGGEDGCLQGLLELAGVPYVGCGVLSSAVCMDKLVTKEILRANGIPQVRFVAVARLEYEANPCAITTAAAELTLPYFVKPVASGSSIGITKVMHIRELDAGIRQAFTFGSRVVIEEGVGGLRELEVAVIGNERLEVSPVGEITHSAEFYDFATKYTADAARLLIPAPVPDEVVQTIQQTALRAYKLLHCSGLARIDFFYQPATGDVFLNELNTVPGLTPGSMFFKLWEEAGIEPAKLVERLVSLALNHNL
uniref:D-alanine--D-alanine ligase n=1 Tax=Mycena chlorophos TaxID=658473 RepID=A0ABQ0LUH0_MYCCL|nr:D-alanine--D-alanine ligase [Mycena chlorophos]